MTRQLHMVSGRLGMDSGFKFGQSDDAIDVDDDGEIVPVVNGLIDLSHALSVTLGRQLPQMAIYRVGFIEIGLRNKDDLNDNEGAGFFGGTIKYHAPTSHKIDALQLARKIERIAESDEVDADSFLLSTDRDYTGFRVDFDSGNAVSYTTPCNVTGISGDWDMEEILALYGQMSTHVASDFPNALWGRRTGGPDQIGWAASIQNRMLSADIVTDPEDYVNPRINNWKLDLPGNAHLDVLAGMLKVSLAHSMSGGDTLTTDDDYEIQVTIGVYGWEGF